MILTESSHKNSALAQFRQVYCWRLKNNRAISILCAALTLISFTVVHLVSSIQEYRDVFDHPENWGEHVTKDYLTDIFSSDVGSNLTRQFGTTLIPLLVIFLIVLTVHTFGYMHQRRSVDLFHALPVQRVPMLLGGMAAIYTVLAGVTIFNVLLCSIIDLAMGAADPYTLAWVLSSLGYLLLILAASVTWTVFFLVSCGTVSGAVMAGILLTFGWPILMLSGTSIIQSSLPGCALSLSGAVATALVPYLAFFVSFSGGSVPFYLTGSYEDVGCLSGEELSGFSCWLVLWWVLLTAVLLAGCILIYRRRKSETAKNHFAYPILRIVIRFLISGAVGLASAVFFGLVTESNVGFYVAAVLGSAAAHIITQIIWVRGVSQLSRSLPAYGVLLAAMAVFFIGVASGGLGFVSRKPAADNVDYCRVSLPGFHCDDSAECYLASIDPELWVNYIDAAQVKRLGLDDGSGGFSLQPKIASQKGVTAVLELHQSLIDQYQAPYLPVPEDYMNTVDVTYFLKNGETMQRSYQLPGVDVYSEEGESQYTEEPNGTPELREKMAQVIALDEIQEFTLFDLLTPERVEQVSSEINNNEGECITGYPAQALTNAQKKKVWNTFVRELRSEDFRYTYREYTESPVNEPAYYIEMDTQWKEADWPDSLRELVERCSEEGEYDPAHQKNISLNSEKSTFYVPKSCKETRKLIKLYVGDNIEYTSYEEGDGERYKE